MKYCSHCGKEIMEAAVICPHCGCPVSSIESAVDVPSTGLNILSFFIPIVGLILYIVYHGKTPTKASASGKWALIGFVVGLVVQGVSMGMLMAL